jgi:hypothetical protein
MSHTPGPWQLHDGKQEITDRSGFHIAFVRPYFSQHAETQKANAELIALCPEMLGIVMRLATCTWFNVAEMTRLVKDSKRIVSQLNQEVGNE